MPIKTNLTESCTPALGGFTLLAAEGPDAEAFLQAQLMNDVRALSPRQWQWNGWLNAKGRVQALFALIRLAPDAFWLVLPDFAAIELVPLLQRYVFRSKVKLRVVDDWQAAASLSSGPGTAAGELDQVQGDAIAGYCLDFSAAGGQRCLRLLPTGHPALAPADAAVDQQWLAVDIMHGLPRLGISQREAWTPQMLSLERLRAFSLKKGCYPGQEIVARTHYLGQAKRHLARLEGNALLAGQDVFAADSKLGSIVCASEDGRQALAVLAAGREQAAPMATATGRCHILPLVDGLGRAR